MSSVLKVRPVPHGCVCVRESTCSNHTLLTHTLNTCGKTVESTGSHIALFTHPKHTNTHNKLSLGCFDNFVLNTNSLLLCHYLSLTRSVYFFIVLYEFFEVAAELQDATFNILPLSCEYLIQSISLSAIFFTSSTYASTQLIPFTICNAIFFTPLIRQNPNLIGHE